MRILDPFVARRVAAGVALLAGLVVMGGALLPAAAGAITLVAGPTLDAVQVPTLELRAAEGAGRWPVRVEAGDVELRLRPDLHPLEWDLFEVGEPRDDAGELRGRTGVERPRTPPAPVFEDDDWRWLREQGDEARSELAAVPEPGSALLLGAGLALLAARRR